jgi:TorA maturation chaperone TorD
VTGIVELWRALGALSETPRPELQAIADLLDLGPLPSRAAHGEIFLFQLYPYASVYLGAEGMMGGEAEDRIAGFWRALGQVPPPRPDHLPLMLAMHARLGELETEAAATGAADAADTADTAGSGAAQRWRHARAAFLWEHLLSWLPIFLGKLLDLAGAADPFYLRWAGLLRDALREEAASLRSPARLPLHLRAAPEGLVDPRTPRTGGGNRGSEGGSSDAFLRSLLSPVRSGMVLVRADLARAARDLGLGLRPGERRLVLASMLGEDAGAVLGWLAGEAATWAARHRPDLHVAPRLASFWQKRAEAAARLLRELAEEAGAAH